MQKQETFIFSLFYSIVLHLGKNYQEFRTFSSANQTQETNSYGY